MQVMNAAVQVCWEKATRYLEIEERYVYCTQDRYVIDPQEVSAWKQTSIGSCRLIWIADGRRSTSVTRTRSVFAGFSG